MDYFEVLRQGFISKLVKENKLINRGDITKEFGVSLPTASSDLARWMADNPEKIEYNIKTRRYEAQI